jgi:hypothetical protein
VNRLLEDVLFKDRDFVLIDESHNLRHPDTQRYKVVEAFLSTGRRCCLLTATPRNKSAWDVYAQIKLFHPDDKTDLPVDPPDLKQYFKLIEKKERKLPDLLGEHPHSPHAQPHPPLVRLRFRDTPTGGRLAIP